MTCATRHRHDRTGVSPRDPSTRIGDEERRRTIGTLRANVGTGHLDFAEYEARVAQALAARTRGDLDAIVVDLPRHHPRHRDPAKRPPSLRLAIRLQALVTAVTAFVTVTVWLATGLGHPWPVYPISGTGTALVALVVVRRTLADEHRRLGRGSAPQLMP